MLIDILQFDHNPVITYSSVSLCCLNKHEKVNKHSTIASSYVYTGSSNYNNISANMNQFENYQFHILNYCAHLGNLILPAEHMLTCNFRNRVTDIRMFNLNAFQIPWLLGASSNSFPDFQYYIKQLLLV